LFCRLESSPDSLVSGSKQVPLSGRRMCPSISEVPHLSGELLELLPGLLSPSYKDRALFEEFRDLLFLYASSTELRVARKERETLKSEGNDFGHIHYGFPPLRALRSELTRLSACSTQFSRLAVTVSI